MEDRVSSKSVIAVVLTEVYLRYAQVGVVIAGGARPWWLYHVRASPWLSVGLNGWSGTRIPGAHLSAKGNIFPGLGRAQREQGRHTGVHAGGWECRGCIPQLQFVEKRGAQVFMNIAYSFESVWLHLLRLWELRICHKINISIICTLW